MSQRKGAGRRCPPHRRCRPAELRVARRRQRQRVQLAARRDPSRRDRRLTTAKSDPERRDERVLRRRAARRVGDRVRRARHERVGARGGAQEVRARKRARQSLGRSGSRRQARRDEQVPDVAGAAVRRERVLERLLERLLVRDFREDYRRRRRPWAQLRATERRRLGRERAVGRSSDHDGRRGGVAVVGRCNRGRIERLVAASDKLVEALGQRLTRSDRRELRLRQREKTRVRLRLGRRDRRPETVFALVCKCQNRINLNRLNTNSHQVDNFNRIEPHKKPP